MANVGDKFVRRTANGTILSELTVIKVTEKSMFLQNVLGKVYCKANTDKEYVTIKPFSDSNFEETYTKIVYTWTQYEYEGLLIQLRDDGREYSIKDFSRVLNEPVTVGGGSSEYSEFSREYCEQMVDELIANYKKKLAEIGF